jgi:hypothetical protein
VGLDSATGLGLPIGGDFASNASGGADPNADQKCQGWAKLGITFPGCNPGGQTYGGDAATVAAIGAPNLTNIAFVLLAIVLIGLGAWAVLK